jgi:CheY-like chemotaxis protein
MLGPSLLTPWSDLLDAVVAVLLVAVLVLVRQMRRAMVAPLNNVRDTLERVREQTEEMSTRLGSEPAAPQVSPLAGLISRRLGGIEAVAISVARDLHFAAAQNDPAILRAAAERSVRRAEWIAELAAGGTAREQQTFLPTVWPRVQALLGPRLEGVSVRTTFAAGLPALVGTGETWAQILAALVENAVEAGPDGIVSLSAEACSTRPDHVLVRVEDRGRGMTADVVSRVLQPLYASPGRSGTRGLGLPLIASLVESLGGSLTIASKVGDGTRVDIEVPGARPALRPSTTRFTGTVLLADDDREMRIATRRLLERFGLEVVEADSGSSAKSQLARNPERFRAAILDVVMPGATVDTVVTAAREGHRALPVLLCSGFNTLAMIDGILALGGVRFLAKPFSSEQLSLTLQDLFSATAGDAPPSPGAIN